MLRQKRSLYFPCSVSVTVLFANLAATSLDRHQRVQRRATKFILNDYQSDYRQRFSKLNTLPLIMLFEINDIVFFIKCIKLKSHLNILIFLYNYVSFCSHHTRSSSHFKLRHSLSKKNSVRHFFPIEYLDFGILFLI